MSTLSGALRLSEVAAVLEEHGGLVCTADADEDDGVITLTVKVHPVGQPSVGDALDALELMHALHYLRDVATLRALAARYDIPAGRLEGLLPAEQPDGHDGKRHGGV